MKNIFIDTNVIIDLVNRRDPWHDAAAEIFQAIEEKKFTGYISSLSFVQIHYLSKKILGAQKSLKVLKGIKNLVKVSTVDSKVIQEALNSEFKDFEDAVQYYSAISSKADLIITRNIKDFKKSNIKVIAPSEFPIISI